MENNQEIYKKLKEHYSDEELAKSIMVPEELSWEEEKQAREELIQWRLKKRQEMSEQDKILSGLLSIKYQIKSYIDDREFNPEKSLSNFLDRYMIVIHRNQKTLAEEIGIHPARLNRILKGKEKIGKSIAYRLETHSGELIPAIYWWKLMQKEVEQEILTEKKAREIEKKHVKEVAYRA